MLLINDDQSEIENAFQVKELIKIAAALRPNWDAAYAEKLIKLFEIPVKKKMGDLSHGNAFGSTCDYRASRTDADYHI